MSVFETWESSDGKARFSFSHSDEIFTTGILTLQPGAELARHNRPLARENLLQISGSCKMTLSDENGDNEHVHELTPGISLSMDKGQWHVHANPFDEESITLFKADGDITAVMKVVRETMVKIQS
ncbi:MAG: cupin domain-containing protein [Candidatus Saccharibacteria bacterium]|nr:cupin domain-containing protein [Candidatus Saccharibacteria bacterium]